LTVGGWRLTVGGWLAVGGEQLAGQMRYALGV